MYNERPSTNRKSYLLWIILLLILIIGFNQRGTILAQPLLHQGNFLLESWRFRDFDLIKSPQALVYYTPSQKEEATLISKEAEDILSSFAKHYNFKPRRPLPIFLFPDRQRMEEHFTTRNSHNANGIYTAGAVYILDPAAWNMSFPSATQQPSKWARLFHKEGPLTHEITHYYLDRTTGGNYPLWYTEAFAQWVEYKELDYERVPPTQPLPKYVLYTYDELYNRFDQLPNQDLAYRQSFLFLRWIIDSHGEKLNKQLQEHLAQGKTFNEAWKRTYGETPKRSYDKWLYQIGR
ncbi:Peptidase [Marininema mesophilum]|uniref:Peptidase n=1 Tax=Marininema mesophilum TaxID=1048340 RepID=A0A1H3AJ22_9BACL|nr:hypothetical protein [Marininema mesophilum]SDX29595.1 Peptidase [Marininema mesophilum]